MPGYLRAVHEEHNSRLDDLRSIAVTAVQSAMEVVREWRERGIDLGVRVVDAESLYDCYETAVDDAAEAAVLEVLRGSDPATPAVSDASEGGDRAGRVWLVDPIDGTTNLILGESFVAVTLALLDGNQLLVAATGCPFTGEVWSAVHGRGTYYDGRRVEVRERPRSSRVLALDPATPPPSQLAVWQRVRDLVGECGEVAPRASIALALAHVSSGQFDGFVQVGGSPMQDFAAGTLLVREAGGLVSGADGRTQPWLASVVIAGTPKTHRDLRGALSGFSLG